MPNVSNMLNQFIPAPHVGEVVRVVHKERPEYGIGIVIKSYEDGRFYMRLVYDNITKGKDGWARYGVDRKSGLYVTPNSSWRVSEKLASCGKTVYHTSGTKKTMSSSGIYLEARPLDEVRNHFETVSTVLTYNDGHTQLTFVILKNKEGPGKDIGACVKGIGSEITKLAYYKAEKHYLELCERRITDTLRMAGWSE